MPPLSPLGPSSASRVKALDWHRGLAVLFMIETHSLLLLSPSLASSPLRLALDPFNGLVAPSFIFAAGFAVALVACRSAKKPGWRRERAPKSLLRIGEVFLVGAILHQQKFHVWSQPGNWVRVDILWCLVAALLASWALVFALGDRPRLIAALAAVLAAGTFALTPWAESLGPPAAHLLNSSTGSPFPLLPWTAWAFAGAACGALAADPARGPALLLAALAALLAIGTTLSFAPLPQSPADMMTRLWKVAAVALTLVSLERLGQKRGWSLDHRALRVLEFFGSRSLSAYFFHIVLLHASVAGIGLAALHRKCSWPALWSILAGVVLATAALCSLWDRLEARFRPPQKPKPGGSEA